MGQAKFTAAARHKPFSQVLVSTISALLSGAARRFAQFGVFVIVMKKSSGLHQD